MNKSQIGSKCPDFVIGVAILAIIIAGLALWSGEDKMRYVGAALTTKVNELAAQGVEYAMKMLRQ